METHFKYFLQHISRFDEEQLDRITSCFRPRSVKKNALLLSAGDVCREFYYVHKGCIRTYFISRPGHEKTRYIILEPSIGTALTSFISQRPSFEFIDALEDSEMLVISHADFYELVKTIPQWKEFYLRILEMAYAFQNNKIESLVTLTASQRYEQVLKENPKLIQMVSNKVLASFLDMTQETLSRLKSK